MTEISSSIFKRIIFKKYKIEKLLSTSKFSWVYEGKNIIKNVPVIMKIEKEGKYNLLESEAYILTIVKGLGIPKVITFGRHSQYKILVEERLGNNLQVIWESNPFEKDPNGQKNIYLKDICLLAIQGLERLKHIHDKNIIHRDIKPENFIIGQNDPDVVYLIDFGFARKYRSSRTGKHIKFSNTGHVIGSWIFSSHNVIRGYEGSRRDDLESFGYMLIYLAKGGWIPWLKYYRMNDLRKIDKAKIITKLKMEINEENLCEGLPYEFVDYIKYVKNLEFEQEPNYQYLNDLFISILSKDEFKRNISFFWLKQKSNEPFEYKSRNKIVKKNSVNSTRSFSKNRLYRKIKDSLDKISIDEDIQKNCTTDKKISLHHRGSKSNLIDKKNNYFEPNISMNSNISSFNQSTSKNLYFKTSSNFTNSNKASKISIFYTISNKSLIHNKIRRKIIKKSGPIKLVYTYNNFNTNIASFNNINNKRIFLKKMNSDVIKDNIYKYIGFIKNKTKTPDISTNDLNLKQNIFYKPIFRKKL